MDITDSVKIIYGRINKYNIDLGSSAKIIGYLLLFHTPEELTEYALSSDKQFYAVIREVNDKFNSMIKHNAASHMPSDHSPRYVSPPPTISGLVTSPSSFRVPAWQPHPNSNEFLGNLRIQPDLPVCSSNYHYSDARLGGGLGSRCSMRSPSGIPSGMIDCSTKPCHYFNGGFCRNGVSCRFSHDKGIPDGISQVYNPSQDDLVNEDHDFSPGLLKKLSVEISEILKENNGGPISMATLLMLYFVRYGKTLQAEDYLTESQRHGKAGCSLTKLLALLKTIQLIVGPHGQHSVVLAEDAPRYMEQYNEKTDAGALLACAHQIYLTFPAESTFTDDDVFNYFKQFGPVQDVRIPRQEKRMFGFVSFQYAETVKTIFETMRPHIICGSRVLVKPYKEKAGIYDRKYSEKVEPPLHYPSHCFHPDINTDINTVPTIYENSGVLNNQLWADQERAFEVERARFMGMHLSPKLPTLQHLEHLKFSDGLSNSVLVSGNNDSTDEKPKPTGNDCSDQESDSIELPDSPFASN